MVTFHIMLKSINDVKDFVNMSTGMILMSI